MLISRLSSGIWTTRTSGCRFCAMSRQVRQWPQGAARSAQLSAWAKALARANLPMAGGPVNR